MAVARTDLGAVSIVPRGQYSSSTFYERLSIVTYDGNSYIALKDSIGVELTNTEYWQQLCMRGLQGIQGPQGVQGPTGPQGEQGLRGIPGHTPVRGTEYWTEEDKDEILRECNGYIQNYINQPFLTFSIQNGNLIVEVEQYGDNN